MDDDYAFKTIADVERRVNEIDNLLFGETTLSESERKSLETEKADLLYYLL